MNHTMLYLGGLQCVDANTETHSKDIYDPKIF